jgi:hypothetical protein
MFLCTEYFVSGPVTLSPGRRVTFIPETKVVAGLTRVREELERRRRRVYLIHGSTYGT